MSSANPHGTFRRRAVPAASLLAAAVAVAALLFPVASLAHARLVRSNPADKAQLAASPAVVELWFSELLDSGFHQIFVYPAAEMSKKERGNLVKGTPAVDPRDRTKISATLQPLAPGEYFVEWRVLSRDGHTAPGRLSFRVLEPRSGK